MVPRIPPIFGRLVLILATLLAGLAAAAPASAQGRIVARHGDWQIRCERDVGAPSEQCALIQNVQAQDRANISLSVLFLRTADQQLQILRVLAPLGVLLPSGLGLSIDGNEVGLAGFVRCLASGCIAEVQLDDGLIQRFDAGQTATFSIFQTPEEGIGIPISLNGFSEGFEALENPPTETIAADVDAPRAPIETSTELVDNPSGIDATAFAPLEDDERTAIDQLLEDELFPYVAGAIGAVFLLVVAGGLLLVRGRRRRTRATPRVAPTTAAEPVDGETDVAAAEDDDGADLRGEPVDPSREVARLTPPEPQRPGGDASSPSTRPTRPSKRPGAPGSRQPRST